MSSWWSKNAEGQGAEPGQADKFYGKAYERATTKAAPKSDSRTGEVFDNSPRPSRGWPFGRPSTS